MTAPDPFAIVRAHFEALNRGDLAGVVELLAEDHVSEAVLPEDVRAEVREGKGLHHALLAEYLARFEGALPDGSRFAIRTMARIETGWIHVEWIERERRRAGGEPLEFAGYSHLLVEDGRIRRQRIVRHRHALEPAVIAGAERPSSRTYPDRPVVGVGAVVMDGGRVLLVKRRFEPLAGQWSLPGGSLEVGESLAAGAAREVREETGLEVDVGPLVEVFDRILLDPEGRVRYHYVLADYLCHPVGGRLQAGSDVADVALVDPQALAPYRLTPKASEVIARAVAMDVERRSKPR